MSRAARLIDLLQSLRRRRVLVTAQELADEHGVSVRTVYRDIATLAGQGAPIEGEPGLGYVLKPGYFPPPLSFSEDEVDALVLGLRWVERRADPHLARAAQDALAKITAVDPGPARQAADAPTVFIGPDKPLPGSAVGIGLFRDAVRQGLKVAIDYADADGRASRRTIWPIGLAFMEDVRFVIAWCELRQDFRHFRLDRIAQASLGDRYPARRAVLLRRWQAEIAREEEAAALS